MSFVSFRCSRAQKERINSLSDGWDAHLGMEAAAFKSLAPTSIKQVFKFIFICSWWVSSLISSMADSSLSHLATETAKLLPSYSPFGQKWIECTYPQCLGSSSSSKPDSWLSDGFWALLFISELSTYTGLCSTQGPHPSFLCCSDHPLWKVLVLGCISTFWQ